jgi:hypothetical protein
MDQMQRRKLQAITFVDDLQRRRALPEAFGQLQSQHIDVHSLPCFLQRKHALRAHPVAGGLVHADFESDLACRAVVCSLQLDLRQPNGP